MFGKFKSWHTGLSKIGKVILWSITAVLAGSAISVAASPDPKPVTAPPSTSPIVEAQSAKSQPVITKKNITETAEIVFDKTSINDAKLEKGKTKIVTAGVNGAKTLTYEITYSDGEQSDKKLLKEEVTTPPVTEVTAHGTYVAPVTPPVVAPAATPSANCDPHYSGACVPIASDVDCAGGSGNGPAYVKGPVQVIGTDIYDLDRDGDGVGCE